MKPSKFQSSKNRRIFLPSMTAALIIAALPAISSSQAQPNDGNLTAAAGSAAVELARIAPMPVPALFRPATGIWRESHAGNFGFGNIPNSFDASARKTSSPDQAYFGAPRVKVANLMDSSSSKQADDAQRLFAALPAAPVSPAYPGLAATPLNGAGEPAPMAGFTKHAQLPPDQDVFGLNRAKIMNPINAHGLERNEDGKPAPAFPQPVPGGVSFLPGHAPLPPIGQFDATALLQGHLVAGFGAGLRRRDNRDWMVKQDPAPGAVAPAPGASIFGSVAIKASRLAIAGTWRRIIEERSERFFLEGCKNGDGPCAAPSWPRWLSVYEQARQLKGAALMQWVNERTNLLISVRSDAALYGEGDHWAGLSETVKAGAGDCEDSAIAKMAILAAVGIPLEAMQMVVLRDVARGVAHAVLAVHHDGQIYVLDSAVDGVRRADTIRHYKPVYTVSVAGSWIHGFQAAAN